MFAFTARDETRASIAKDSCRGEDTQVLPNWFAANMCKTTHPKIHEHEGEDMRRQILLCVAAVLAICCVGTFVHADTQGKTRQSQNSLASRKSVTVFARNAATASSKAQSSNPGWTVVSVTKVNKDPKSMAYRVVLKK